MTVSVPTLPLPPGRSVPALVSVAPPRSIVPLPWTTPTFSKAPAISVAPLNTSSVPALTGKSLAVSTPSSTRSVPLLVSGIASVTAAVPVLRSRPALSMRPLPPNKKSVPPTISNSPDASTDRRPPSWMFSLVPEVVRAVPAISSVRVSVFALVVRKRLLPLRRVMPLPPMLPLLQSKPVFTLSVPTPLIDPEVKLSRPDPLIALLPLVLSVAPDSSNRPLEMLADSPLFSVSRPESARTRALPVDENTAPAMLLPAVLP